jgi:hypothetical protein
VPCGPRALTLALQILDHVANYISLAERAREHCGTVSQPQRSQNGQQRTACTQAAETEMRKKECAMESAAEGYAKLADALDEYACSG